MAFALAKDFVSDQFCFTGSEFAKLLLVAEPV